MNVTTALISAALTLSGIYAQDKGKRPYWAILALAMVVNYYSGFTILFFELARSARPVKRLLHLLLEFMPLAVLVTAHILIPERIACTWFPDFSMWEQLYDLHCQNVFLWFWTAYILELCYALYLSLMPNVSDAHKGLAGGLMISTSLIFFSTAENTYCTFLIVFAIAFAYKCTDLKAPANLYMAAILVLATAAVALSFSSYGPVGRLLSTIFEKLEFLGFTFVVLAAMVAVTISFIWEWNKTISTEEHHDNQ
jgi:hypothetical protein